MSTLIGDIKYGFRQLRKNPGFTITIIAILGLGIGVTTMIFGVAHGVLWRSLNVPYADRLVGLWEEHPEKGQVLGVSPLNFLDWRRQADGFEQIIAYTSASFVITGQGDPERVDGQKISAGFLEVLGMKPILGRPFTMTDEDTVRQRVVIISHRLWQRRLGGDTSAIGQNLIINDESYTVIGVVQSDPTLTNEAQVWIPLRFGSKQREPGMRGAKYLNVLGRLEAGITITQAQQRMRRLSEQIAEQDPVNKGWSVTVIRWRDHLVREVRTALWVLLGAAVLLLFAVCTNVTNLFVARMSSRHKELAIRKALGATRRRLLRLTGVESLLLSVMGGLVGLAIASWGINLLKTFTPWEIPRLNEVMINGWLILCCVGLTLLTGIVCGLLPVVPVLYAGLIQVLRNREQQCNDIPGGNFLFRSLVVIEITLSVILLISAGLLLRSFINLRSVNPGFSPNNTLALTVFLPTTRYPQAHQQADFFQKFLARVETTPKVAHAALCTNLPFSGFKMIFDVRPVSPTQDSGDSYFAQYHSVSLDYFRTLGISLLKGRVFTARDNDATSRVVMINEALARHFGGPELAIGQDLAMANENMRVRTIVGVVENVRHTSLDADIAPEVYVPFAQNPWSFSCLIVRTQEEAIWLAATLREYLRSLDPGLPINEIVPVKQLIGQTLAPARCRTILVIIFSVVALLLAAISLYGVVSYTVGRRIHEFGIRMSLGAKARDIIGHVLGRGLRLTLTGLCFGLTGAWGLTRLLQRLLYQVSPTDHLVFIIVTVILTGVSMLACWVPAWRAARIDPMEALRYE